MTTWNEIIKTAERTQSGDAQIAYDENKTLPIDTHVVVESDDVYRLVLGTEEGDVVVTEDTITYADGETISFRDDDDRDIKCCGVMAPELYNAL